MPLFFFYLAAFLNPLVIQFIHQNNFSMRKFMISTALTLLMATTSLAGGYQVSLHGQKQSGMGLIGTSLQMDASAAYFNPGALAMMPDQLSILGGVSGILSSVAFQMEQPSLYQATTDNPMGTPFYFYAAGMITNRLAAGLAVKTPYGNSLSWEDNWAGRFLIQDISLSAITIQPTVSYRLTHNLSVGAGFVYALGTVDMERALPVEGPEGEGRVNIEGSTANFGFNAGIQYSHPGGINFGLSYRSQIDMEVDDADALFNNIPGTLSAAFPAENKVAVTLPLPANLDFGLSYQATPDLMVGMALNYVFWEAYEELHFDFEINTPNLQDSHNPRDYSNTLIFRAGGEYRVNEGLFVRAGAYFDPSPVNEEYFSPETPSLDVLAFTGGMSYLPTRNLSIDASLLFLMGLEQDMMYAPENFGGTYKSRVIIPGIGISYSL